MTSSPSSNPRGTGTALIPRDTRISKMLLAKPKTKLGPHDHGRKMSLKAFEFAQVEDGYVYELQRGYVIVSEVANYLHAMQIVALMEPLWLYRAANPGVIHAILANMDCKLVIREME